MDTFDPNRKDLVSLSEIHRSVLFCFFSFFLEKLPGLAIFLNTEETSFCLQGSTPPPGTITDFNSFYFKLNIIFLKSFYKI